MTQKKTWNTHHIFISPRDGPRWWRESDDADVTSQDTTAHTGQAPPCSRPALYPSLALPLCTPHLSTQHKTLTWLVKNCLVGGQLLAPMSQFISEILSIFFNQISLNSNKTNLISFYVSVLCMKMEHILGAYTPIRGSRLQKVQYAARLSSVLPSDCTPRKPPCSLGIKCCHARMDSVFMATCDKDE